MRLFFFISMALLIVLASLVGCDKENNNDTQNEQSSQEIISGNVILPPGLNSDTKGWLVNSGFGESKIDGGKYSVLENINGFNPQFLSDVNDNVILMGYSYPGQTDKTISSQSTILALSMLLPGVNSLNDQGKLNLINRLKTNTKFSEAVQLLENHLSAGYTLFDESNGAAFFEKVTELFNSASFRRNSTQNKNVNYIVSGKTVAFQNPGKSFNQVVGIYSNGNLIKQFSLSRYQYVATSITEGITNSFEPPSPIEEVFTFPADGKYDIKIRTGKSLDDEEGKLAAISNLTDIAIDWYVKPYLNKKIENAEVKQQCLKELGVLLADHTITLLDNASSVTDASLILEVASFGVNLIPKLLACSKADLGNNAASKYLSKWIKVTEFLTGKLSATVSFVNNFINLGIATYQWLNSPAVQDTCFKITGNQIRSCDDCILNTFTDARDGKVYKTVQIGSQIWMAENLSYATATSWCYDNNPSNCNLYGRLYEYDWYTTDNACPAGWHLPSDAEWATLIDFLGGSNIAGGKMKHTGTQFWLGPNTDATNSSCFSGLPGGSRGATSGNFGNIGKNGMWWTKDGWFRNLNYDNGFINKYSSPLAKNALSVRCVKN